MRRGLASTFGLSLGAHVVVALALTRPLLLAPPTSNPAPRLAGETFELPAPPTESSELGSPEDLPPADVAATEGAPPAPPSVEGQARAPKPRARAAAATRSSRLPGGRGETPQAGGEAGGSGTSALYGAVGERSASDLSTAFTRGFPQAASADPAWRSAPLGSAGSADVVITLDEDGHVTNVDVGGAPSAALSGAIKRTVALVKDRPFVARAKTTRLRLVATVSADEVHDGLHGDVFAIGGSFAGGEGSAFFALAIGRRVDLVVRAK